jgi:hypothetical protein
MKKDNHFLSTEAVGDLNAPIPWWTWVVPIFIQVLGRIVSPFLTVIPGIYLLYLPYLTGVPLVLWWGPRFLWVSGFRVFSEPGLFLFLVRILGIYL